MNYDFRPVDLHYIESASLRFENEVEIDASTEQMFKVLKKERSVLNGLKMLLK
jgi:hypothetical protein